MENKNVKKYIIGGVAAGAAACHAVKYVEKKIITNKIKRTREYLNTDMDRVNDYYIGDEDFTEKMSSEVIPYLREYGVDGYFESTDGTRLHYQKYELTSPLAKIVVSHGFCEFQRKYDEIVYYFLKAGYSVYFVEHRGHGYSDREIDDLEKVHIERFDEYVEDFNSFIEQVVDKSDRDVKKVLFAHSMGGAIAAMYLERYNKIFDMAILSSPMLDMEIGKYPLAFAKALAAIKNLVRKGDEYVIGHHGFDGEYNLDKSSCQSEQRYRYAYDNRVKENRYKMSGGTYRWLEESLRAIRHIGYRRNIKKASVNILLFQAENDRLVRPFGQERFAFYNDSVRLVYVKESKHEIFNSREEIRTAYFEEIFNFIKSNL